MPSITPALVGTLAANLIAVAVAFGVNLTADQVTKLLTFTGTVTLVVFAIVAALQAHHVRQAVKLATSPVQSSSTAAPGHAAAASPGAAA